MLGQKMTDDREEFLTARRQNSIALGEDDVAFREARDAFITVDKYRYPYLWTWLGIPIIQMPADIMATQEVIWETKPDIIIETGVARGGSVLFLASMLQLIGRGKVIGVDIDIRPHNRNSIEEHPLSSRVRLIQGSSIASETLAQVKAMIPPSAAVMVILDADHSYQHVREELEVYGPLVTPGQYLVVADTLLGRLDPTQTPTERSAIWKPGNEPLAALSDYLSTNAQFKVDAPLNGKLVFASSPGGYVRREV
jgi:cephalosporin hydroxylase